MAAALVELVLSAEALRSRYAAAATMCCGAGDSFSPAIVRARAQRNREMCSNCSHAAHPATAESNFRLSRRDPAGRDSFADQLSSFETFFKGAAPYKDIVHIYRTGGMENAVEDVLHHTTKLQALLTAL